MLLALRTLAVNDATTPVILDDSESHGSLAGGASVELVPPSTQQGISQTPNPKPTRRTSIDSQCTQQPDRQRLAMSDVRTHSRARMLLEARRRT